MSRYFFDIHQCSGDVRQDEVGHEAATLEEARAIAMAMARSFMAEEVSHGRLCLSCWIVVNDAQRHHVMTVQFGEAITITVTKCGIPDNHPPDEHVAAARS